MRRGVAIWRYRLRHALLVMATNLHQVGPTVSFLTLMRSPRQGPFGPADRTLLEQLRPHLQRVAKLNGHMAEIRQESEIARDLLDSVQTCLIAADATAQIVRMNRVAETVLRAGGGVRAVSGRLVAPTHAQTETLHGLIHQAVATTAGTVSNGGGGPIIEGASGERHGIMVMPLNSRSTVRGKPALPLALVAVSSLQQQAGPDRHLIDMFGLTRSEAQLAAEIAAGKRLDALAEERRVRMTTLRTQVHAIYSKTGTSRQAELVHLVAGLPRLHGTTRLTRSTVVMLPFGRRIAPNRGVAAV